MSVFERVREIAGARRAGEAPALEAGGRRLTYRDLVDAVEGRAEALGSTGSGPVALPADDPVSFLVDHFAASLCGRASVAHPSSVSPAVRARRDAALARTPPAGGATVFYSSGSVGAGRAVPLSAANLEAAAVAFESWGEITRADRVAIGLPPSQILAFVRGALNALAVGAEAVFFVPRRDPLEEAHRLGATRVLVASGHVALAARHTSRPGIGALLCGGGPVDPAAADRIETLRGVPVRSGYGMTESAGLGARQPVGRPRRAGSAGRPAPNLEVVVTDDGGSPCPPGHAGEIRLAGAAVFSGYLDPEDAPPFDAAGRLRTGDVGFLDAEGELRVRGRLAFALRAGDRILCAEEVEAAIAEHPAVAEAAAAPLERTFGVLVVPRGETITVGEIRAHAVERLPAFARPRRILSVKELPRTPAGKVDRSAASRWLTDAV